VQRVDELVRQGQTAEAVALLEQALAGPLPAAERFSLEMRLADILAYHRGDSAGSLTHYRSALALARESGLAGGYRALLGIAHSLQQQGRPAEALAHLAEAAAGAAAAHDDLTLAAALLLRGEGLLELGEHPRALAAFREAEAAARAAGRPGLEAQAAAGQALLQALGQAFAEAEETGRRALALAKESGDTGIVALAYLRMGQVMACQGRHGPAFYWFRAGAEVAREAGLSDLANLMEHAAHSMGVRP